MTTQPEPSSTAPEKLESKRIAEADDLNADAKRPKTEKDAENDAPAGDKKTVDLHAYDKTNVSFPERLMDLLNYAEDLKDHMWWLEDGEAFAVVPEGFETVLDKHFQGTKFESFTRKLNRWGFKRAAGQRVPTQAIAYFHPLFRKNEPEKVKDMRSGSKRAERARNMLSESLPAAPGYGGFMGLAGLYGMSAPIVNQQFALQQLLQQQQAAQAERDLLQLRQAQQLMMAQQGGDDQMRARLLALQQQGQQAGLPAGLGGAYAGLTNPQLERLQQFQQSQQQQQQQQQQSLGTQEQSNQRVLQQLVALQQQQAGGVPGEQQPQAPEATATAVKEEGDSA